MTPEKSLDYYKRMFAEARDLTQEARKESQTDDDYRHGHQWSAEEKAELRKRKQPDSYYNYVRLSVNGTIGVLKQGATDPRAYGRNPQDEDSAEVATKVLRYIADENDFDSQRIEGADSYLVQGTVAAMVGVDENGRVKVDMGRWEEFFYDPRSRFADFRDARYMGFAKWMYADQVTALGAKANEVELALSGAFGALDDTFDDRPQDARGNWVDRKHRRLMVVEMYHREGKDWYRCLFYSGGVIEQGISEYVEKGRYGDRRVNPIVAQSCFVDRENNRYGIVRDMRPVQDGINKRESKLLHLLNNRQVQANNEIAMSADAELVREEASKPDGVIPPGWKPVSINDMAAGQFNLLSHDKEFISRLGPNPAVLAREGENSSGRNNLIRQQAGMTEQAVVFGGMEHWERRIYRAMWNRARQFWTAPDYIRITDDEGAPQFIGINQPKYGQPQVVLGPDGMPTIQPTVLGYENALAELDVDITLDTVPDTANLAQEQFLALTDLARSGVPIPPQILLEASSLPKKREIIEKLKAMDEQNAPLQQMQQQITQIMAQLEMQQKQADIKKTESETVENIVDAQAKAASTQINAFEVGSRIASQGMPAAGA
ncbi:hypothetical protein [Novosphingobium mathurense]|uniref:Phage P22-like portal protein n=1 Tax=Novosphingobium mathurense TaxID=428990 RepID=A0A1U6I731_9SPHN|nr:hypothetical protein [Novosphingobium mathurense]SLK03825.1 hypothetical protein SAMN06295987_104295 [Novosphingobium mathurense]